MTSLAKKWLSPDHIRLHAGELTAQEMRTVLAVLRAVFRETEAQTQAMNLACRSALRELEDVLASCNAEKVHFDGDDFHEAMESLRKVLSGQEN